MVRITSSSRKPNALCNVGQIREAGAAVADLHGPSPTWAAFRLRCTPCPPKHVDFIHRTEGGLRKVRPACPEDTSLNAY